MKSCACGCGEPVNAKFRWAIGHAQRGANSGRWRGGISYPTRTVNGRKLRMHVLRAERALGRPLPAGAQVHHVDGTKSSDSPLVICPSLAYHQLLHVRTRIVKAGGDPDTQRICRKCGLRPLTEFYVRKTGYKAGQVITICRDCVAQDSLDRKDRRRHAVAV